MTTSHETKAQAPAIQFVIVSHEGIPCRRQDLDACIKFYVDVLGCELMQRPKALNDLGDGAWLMDPAKRVQFHLIANDDESPAPGKKASPAGRHTSYFVQDIDAFCARMTALGVPYSTVNLVGPPQVFVVDPAGHTWEFQPAPKSIA
jgi:catechol 2,3-dioxygenase-like lactoylglutathione lyase family enzyme